MIGIRTPVKRTADRNSRDKSPQLTAEEAGPSQQNVRKSVGEWESNIGGSSVSRSLATPPLKTKSQPPTKKATNLPKQDSPTTVTPRGCLDRINYQIGQSRNLKTEIKEEIQRQVKLLYIMAKNATNKNLAEAKKTGTSSTAHSHRPQTGSVPDGMATGISKPEVESLKIILEEHTRKLAENAEKMDRLKEALQTSQHHIEHSSYASAAASQPAGTPSRHKALHSIAVATEDETATGEAVLNKIREAVDAKDQWIKVEKVRKTKNRRVIMSFESIEDRDKVKDRLRTRGTDLTVEDVKNRDPLIVLKDVLAVNKDEDILKALRNQNKEIFHGLEEENNRIQVKYRRRARNQHTAHVVISTSPVVWQRMTSKGYAYVDLQRVRVEDQSPLLQCSLCLGYGHSRKLCTEKVEKCSHCGGPHVKNKCADWLSGSAPSCCNCTHAKVTKTDHNAFSTECTVRRKWDTIARAAIAYC